MKSIKKKLAFVMAIMLMFGIIPMMSFAEGNEDDTLFFEQIDLVWEELEQAEAAAIAQGLDKEGVINAVKQVALTCELIDTSSIQDCTSGDGFIFDTVLGAGCIYDGIYDEPGVLNEEEVYNQISNNPDLAAEMMEMYQADMAQAQTTSTANSDSSRNVLLVQPFLDFNEELDTTYHIFQDKASDGTALSGNSYFRNIAVKIAQYTGGTYTLLYGKNATVDAISKALDTNAIVLFITHGLYQNGKNIIKLTTREGITQNDLVHDSYYELEYNERARTSPKGAAYIDATYLVPKTRNTFVENSIFWMGTCYSMEGHPGNREKLLGNWLIEHGAAYAFGITDKSTTGYQGEYVEAFFDSLIDNESSALTAFLEAAGNGYYTYTDEGDDKTGYPAIAYADEDDAVQFIKCIESDENDESEGQNNVNFVATEEVNDSTLSTWKLIKASDITTGNAPVPLYKEANSVQVGESYILTYEVESKTYAVSSVLEEMSLGESSSNPEYQNNYPYIMELEKTENSDDNTVSFLVEDSYKECGTNIEAFELMVVPYSATSSNVALFNETVQKYLAISADGKPTYTYDKYEWQITADGKVKSVSANKYVEPKTTTVPYYAYYTSAPHANGYINIERLEVETETETETESSGIGFSFTLHKRINPDMLVGKLVGNDVNYRQGPNLAYPNVVDNQKLALDTELVIFDYCQGWWYVSPAYNLSVKGWIYGDFVSVTGETNTVISTVRANSITKLKEGASDTCGDNATIYQNTSLNIYYTNGQWCYASRVSNTSLRGWVPREDLDYSGTYPISNVISNVAEPAKTQYSTNECMPTSIEFDGMTLNSAAITLLMARTLIALDAGQTEVVVEESSYEMPTQTYTNYLTYNSFDSSEIAKVGYMYAAEKCVEYFNEYHRVPNYVMFPGSSGLGDYYNGRFSSLLANIVFVKAVCKYNDTNQLPGSVETTTNYYQVPSSSAQPSPVPTIPPTVSTNLQSGVSTFTVNEIAEAALGILQHYEAYAAYPGEYSVAKGVVIKRGDTEYCITDQDWAYMAGYALAGYTGMWSDSNLSGYGLDTEIIYRKANKPARSANATYVTETNGIPRSVTTAKVVEMAWKGSKYANERRAEGEGTTMAGCCSSAFPGYQVTYYSILIASARLLNYIANNTGTLPETVAYNAIHYKVTDTDVWNA